MTAEVATEVRDESTDAALSLSPPHLPQLSFIIPPSPLPSALFDWYVASFVPRLVVNILLPVACCDCHQ